MIGKLISHENRQKRRKLVALARKKNLNITVERACAEDVFDHIVTLSKYMISAEIEFLKELISKEGGEVHLAVYIGSAKPIGLGTEAASEQRERVLHTTRRNLFTDTLEDQQFELALAAGMTPGRLDSTEHIVLSWPKGEEPTQEQIEELIDLLLQVLQMERHQLLAAVHGDTDNIHLHVMLNRVDPFTGERRELGNGAGRLIEALHQAIAVVEHRQGWTPQTHALYTASEEGVFDRETGRQVLDRKLEPTATRGDWKAIRVARKKADTDAKITGPARRFELRTGFHSLQRRMLEEAAPELRESKNWDDVHLRLAPLGMRYRVLASGGAVIDCAGREIKASAAWGGASESKMVGRLGPYIDPPAKCIVAPFEERIFPAMQDAVAKRRRRKAIRDAERLAKASVVSANAIIAEHYLKVLDRLETENLETTLNGRRAAAAAACKDARVAIAELRKRLIQLHRAERAGAAREPDVERPEEAEEDQPLAILLGVPRAGNANEATPGKFPAKRHRAPVRHLNARLEVAFVEREDRIDIYSLDDADVRSALLVARRKWGSVVAAGDTAALIQIARIAVEENVTLTNPELQPIIGVLRETRDRERAMLRDLRVPEAETVVPLATTPPPATPEDLASDYDSVFIAWSKLRQEEPAKADAEALRIMSDQRLMKELEELLSQQVAFAEDLKNAGERERRRRAASAKADDLATAAAPLSRRPQADLGDRPPIAPPGWMVVTPDRLPALDRSARAQGDRLKSAFLEQQASAAAQLAFAGDRPTLLGGHFLARAKLGEFERTDTRTPPSPCEETFRTLERDRVFAAAVRAVRSGTPTDKAIEDELALRRGAWEHHGRPSPASRSTAAIKITDRPEILTIIDRPRLDAEAQARVAIKKQKLLTMIGELVLVAPDAAERLPVDSAGCAYRSVQDLLLPEFLLQQEERRQVLHQIAIREFSVEVQRSTGLWSSTGWYPPCLYHQRPAPSSSAMRLTLDSLPRSAGPSRATIRWGLANTSCPLCGRSSAPSVRHAANPSDDALLTMPWRRWFPHPTCSRACRRKLGRRCGNRAAPRYSSRRRSAWLGRPL